MTTTSHESTHLAPERRRWSDLLVTEMWASVAISVIWLTVLFDALFGPDIQTRGVAGDTAVIPSAVVISVFAFLATWVVARHGLRRDRTD
jgi:multisubunit Na+/H+ antiporter MnhF subunit